MVRLPAPSVPIPAPPADELDLRFEIEGNTLIAHLVGNAGPRQLARLDGQLARLGSYRLPLTVIDLSQVESLSCLVVGAIASLWRGLRRRGGELRVVAPRGAVHDALSSSWLARELPVFAASELALAVSPVRVTRF